jgi:hypothetical protein
MCQFVDINSEYQTSTHVISFEKHCILYWPKEIINCLRKFNGFILLCIICFNFDPY